MARCLDQAANTGHWVLGDGRWGRVLTRGEQCHALSHSVFGPQKASRFVQFDDHPAAFVEVAMRMWFNRAKRVMA